MPAPLENCVVFTPPSTVYGFSSWKQDSETDANESDTHDSIHLYEAELSPAESVADGGER